MLKKVILSALFLLVLTVVIVQFPKLFIGKVGAYKSFTIYSNKAIEIDESVKIVLDSVLSNLQESAFHNDDNRFELFFIKGTFYEKLIRLLGRKNIAFSKFEKHIYAATPNFKTGVLGEKHNAYEWLNLVQVISHEGVHSQMYPDYYKNFRMITPFWINEGYSEYISYRPIREQEGYHLSDLVQKLESNEDEWLITEYHSMTPREYVKSRVLIEYLIDVEQREITDIIEDKTLDPNKLYLQIKSYYTIPGNK
ncbi:MAG: hypothetical protein AAF502_17635 [Bacteroidota bacterium]